MPVTLWSPAISDELHELSSMKSLEMKVFQENVLIQRHEQHSIDLLLLELSHVIVQFQQSQTHANAIHVQHREVIWNAPRAR